VSEAFKKPFSIFIELPPQSVINRIENMKNKNTEIKVTDADNGSFSVEIDRKWGFANPYLRFRVWQPEPNIKFSQIDGETGAVIAWSYILAPLVLAFPLACCFCTTVLFSPGGGQAIPIRLELGIDDSWKYWENFNYFASLTAFFAGLVLLHILSSPLASYLILREFRYYFPDEAESEKKKRG
jgi:hypothetical protein